MAWLLYSGVGKGNGKPHRGAYDTAKTHRQEAYNIAMVIDQYFGPRKGKWDTTILATDISMRVRYCWKVVRFFCRSSWERRLSMSTRFFPFTYA